MRIITNVTNNGTNTYLIVDNGKGVVIDPADGIDKIIDFAENNGITIKHALVTHSHYDHIGGIAELCHATGATLYMSKTDYELVKFDGGRSLFGAPREVFTPDVYVGDGDILTLIGHEFKVIATPGHTPGGVCFLVDDHLFSGDTLFMMSIGRTDFDHASYEQLSESIINKLFVLDGGIKVYPGHGESTTIDYERKYNRYV